MPVTPAAITWAHEESRISPKDALPKFPKIRQWEDGTSGPIAVQVLEADLAVDALAHPLQHQPEALHAVGRSQAPGMLSDGALDRLVPHAVRQAAEARAGTASSVRTIAPETALSRTKPRGVGPAALSMTFARARLLARSLAPMTATLPTASRPAALCAALGAGCGVSRPACCIAAPLPTASSSRKACRAGSSVREPSRLVPMSVGLAIRSVRIGQVPVIEKPERITASRNVSQPVLAVPVPPLSPTA